VAAVRPREHPSAVHLIIFPLASVFSAVGPGVNSFALDIIVEEIALIS
jgi:uncharacterized membrane protein YqaE (UPF0057 family)